MYKKLSLTLLLLSANAFGIFGQLTTKLPFITKAVITKQAQKFAMQSRLQFGQTAKIVIAVSPLITASAYVRHIAKYQEVSNYSEDPTDAHYAEHHNKIHADNHCQLFFTDPNLHTLVERIREIRATRDREGYATFVHGQPFQVHFLHLLNEDLREMRTNRPKTPDYIQPHIRTPLTWSIFSPFTRDVERKLRQDLLTADGSRLLSQDVFLTIHKHAKFCNYPFFGNASFTDGCTPSYIVENKSYYFKPPNVKHVFETNGYTELYAKYEKELKNLYEYHNNLTCYGNLLVISVKRNYLPKLVRLVKEKKPDRLINAEYLAEYRKNPDNKVHFLIAMTHDLALNPDAARKGIIKVAMVNVPNSSKDFKIQKEWQKFKKQYDELIVKMHADVQKKR